jgi:sialic acid synthase SpsE
VGYSDHSQGIEISVAAAALGARVIEKHFTLDRTLPGPDHEASLEPADLAALVQAIRNVEEALGNGLKKPSPVEMANRRIVRQSIVAAVAIPKGIFLEDRHLATRRPADGLSPMLWDQVVGRRADRDYAPGDPLFPDAVWEKA